MHPYLTEQIARAHQADLRRAALVTCCARLVARLSLHDRLAAATRRLTVFVRPPRDRTAPACCAA